MVVRVSCGCGCGGPKITCGLTVTNPSSSGMGATTTFQAEFESLTILGHVPDYVVS